MKNTTTVIAELQAGHSLSISNRKPVGAYSCIGEPTKLRGKQNMSAFSIFKLFTEIESFEFFTMMENRNKLTNEVDASYVDNYTEYEIKRFRKAVKSLIEKDCIKPISKKGKLYMVNPRIVLGSFEAMDELIAKYESLN